MIMSFKEEKWRVKSKRLDLADKLEKAMRLIELEDKYVEKWEDQRKNVNKELIKEEENRLLKQKYTILNESEIEKKCMAEVFYVLSEFSVEMNQHEETWEKIYAKDVGAFDTDILILEQEQEDLDNSNKRLQENANELPTLINEFEDRKHKREEHMKFKIHINNMALIIQAFWRGIMVRKFLGRFKKLKKLFKNKPVRKNNKLNKKKL